MIVAVMVANGVIKFVSIMPKQFYHKPTQTILTQTDWNDPESQGDFTFITSEALVNQSLEPYAYNIVAYLVDCEEITDNQNSLNYD